MNRYIGILTAAVLAASFGCAKKETEPHDGEHASPPEAQPAGKGAALGTTHKGEHFAIRLTADPSELKVGRATLRAEVLHNGEPTSDAKVRLELSMPEMSMGGPTVELAHTKGGIYAGEAELSMGGNWRAKVTVEQEGHLGEAIFDFAVMQ